MSCCARIERLLKAHEPADGFLESSPAVVDATDDYQPIDERPGAVIGPYKLLQQIGEGGMGIVYMAEQTRAGPPPGRPQDHQARHGQPPGHRPLRGRAAGAGVDGPPEHRPRPRRRHHRKADAGRGTRDEKNTATQNSSYLSGRPYFVMELVHGVPITQYCDDNQLTPRERLELFVPSARPSSTPIRRGSSTATSSRPTFW